MTPGIIITIIICGTVVLLAVLGLISNTIRRGRVRLARKQLGTALEAALRKIEEEENKNA